VSDLKTKVNDASVSGFLEAIADEAKRHDSQELLEMMKKATGSQPRMWGTSIVGFGSYHYRYASGREGEFMLCGFSPRKASISIYIMPGFRNYDSQLNKLGKHKTGKSCLYINRLEQVDREVLQELITESVAEMRSKYPDST
jgi:hypothetical protein